LVTLRGVGSAGQRRARPGTALEDGGSLGTAWRALSIHYVAGCPQRGRPGAFVRQWKKLTAVAHTLPYDAALIEPYQSGRPLPPGQWAAVTMPTLVMCGDEKESPGLLRHGSAAVAAALPAARLVERRGLGHAKKLTPSVIAATLTEFIANGEHAAI
jgi:hypothetical protein